MTDNVISFIQNDPDDCMHKMAFKYIDKIMFEFFSIPDNEKCQKDHMRRRVFYHQSVYDHLDRTNQSLANFHENLYREDLGEVIQFWLKTRKCYDKEKRFPAGNIINWFVFAEPNAMMLYLIYDEFAYLSITPPKIISALQQYAKACQRFIDCRNDKIIVHFNYSEDGEKPKYKIENRRIELLSLLDTQSNSSLCDIDSSIDKDISLKNVIKK